MGSPTGINVFAKEGLLVADGDSDSNLLHVACKVCNSHSIFFGETDVLKEYRVKYFRCERCGFIQTEEPYWLNEAYSSAIARQDVGIMQRNLMNCEVTSAVLNLLYPDVSSALDYGAGHGVLVRMMRDRGFNYFWSDLHATNDYARGFDRKEGSTYDFISAFEVLEHLDHPVVELSELMRLSANVFVSTSLVPQPPPGLSEWWYYAPPTGQHISFYTLESLHLLADQFGRCLLSNGSYHLFTMEPKSVLRFRLATSVKMAGILNRMYRRTSLIDSDFQSMVR